MTTKRTAKETPAQNGKPPATWRGFVNIELTKEQKESALRMTENVLDFLGCIETVLQAGYRLSITFSESEKVYNATITGTERHMSDAGIAVTARSMKVENSIAGAMTKVLDAAEGNLASLFEGVQYRQTDL